MIKATSKKKTNSIVFFRDDDVGELDVNIVRITELFQKLNTPLSLEVIPKNIQKEFLDYFDSIKSTGLFDVGQHGYAHIRYKTEGINKGEFGSNRTASEKKEDIVAGWDIISKSFGSFAKKIFIPPWGLMDEETYNILRDLKYESFSCIEESGKFIFLRKLLKKQSDYAIIKKKNGGGLLNLSISIDNMKFFEKRIPKTTDELIRRYERLSGKTKYIGIMLHDKIMNDEAFKALEDFLVYLKTRKVPVMSMSEIVEIIK
jgi:peptidoglycan/xylan/chitin deacetylase (PgdA/CDA1 family)